MPGGSQELSVWSRRVGEPESSKCLGATRGLPKLSTLDSQLSTLTALFRVRRSRCCQAASGCHLLPKINTPVPSPPAIRLCLLVARYAAIIVFCFGFGGFLGWALDLQIFRT